MLGVGVVLSESQSHIVCAWDVKKGNTPGWQEHSYTSRKGDVARWAMAIWRYFGKCKGPRARLPYKDVGLI